MDVHVKVKPPLARRCRCGMCFDAAGQIIAVDKKELAALRSDPWLVVTDKDVSEAEAKKDDAKEAAKKNAKVSKPAQQADEDAG